MPEVESMDASRWWKLFRLMQQNHVAALCFEAASKAGAPRDVLMPWLSEHEKAVDWHRHQAEVQQEIVGMMQQHGIKTLVLKGTHLSEYYPKAELREFGDLDLYFYDRHDEADRIAAKELGVRVKNDSHHHSKYNYRGVTVESHYDFVNTHYPPSNRRYEAMLKKLVGTEDFSLFEVLFLLRHTACHFAASRMTLRDLVDWALTCRVLHDKVDWNMVQDTVKQYGMESFFTALNTIAASRLGIQPPCHSATLSPSHSDTQSLIEHDMVYGSPVADHEGDGLGRLRWKLHRWHTMAWKRRMVYRDSELSLLLASLTSHAEKPQSILHKM